MPGNLWKSANFSCHDTEVLIQIPRVYNIVHGICSRLYLDNVGRYFKQI